MKGAAFQLISDSAPARKQHKAVPPPVPVSPFLQPITMDAGPLIQRKSACACGGDCPRCASEPESIFDLQTKLIVGEPHDEHEREADQVADQVMRMAAPEQAPAALASPGPARISAIAIRRKSAQSIPRKIQRKAEAAIEHPTDKEKDQQPAIIQTKAAGGGLTLPPRQSVFRVPTLQRQSDVKKDDESPKGGDTNNSADEEVVLEEETNAISSVQTKAAADVQRPSANQTAATSAAEETSADQRPAQQEHTSGVLGVEQRIVQTRGGGLPLVSATQQFMEDSLALTSATCAFMPTQKQTN